MQLDELAQSYASQAKRIMWFLGAGASRNAGMPTADDLIWELRLRLYCAAERQDIQSHDLANKALRERIESYFESKGAPARWAADEYTYFFEAAFGTDYAAQQRFLQDELNSSKISLNIGNRILAALLSMQATNVVFSTNFDDVLEQAFATVGGRNITAFHLEGSYAALDAINSDQFPVYAKLHGDFRYRSLKNLSQGLKSARHDRNRV
jgi:SIR2-like domain